MWNDISKYPESRLIGDTYFSDNLLVKVKEDTLKGFYYMVAYINITEGIWFNPVAESEIEEEIMAWKYIED